MVSEYDEDDPEIVPPPHTSRPSRTDTVHTAEPSIVYSPEGSPVRSEKVTRRPSTRRDDEDSRTARPLYSDDESEVRRRPSRRRKEDVEEEEGRRPRRRHEDSLSPRRRHDDSLSPRRHGTSSSRRRRDSSSSPSRRRDEGSYSPERRPSRRRARRDDASSIESPSELTRRPSHKTDITTTGRITPTDTVHTIIPVPPPPRAPSDLGDFAYDDAERERQERFGEIEKQLLDVASAATEGEDRREAEFRHNEEERDRLFLEHEREREEEAARRRDQIWEDLERKLAGAPPVPIPPPQIPYAHHESSADTESIVESIRSAAHTAASRHADSILETVRSEREELAREREAHEAERERLRAEAEMERQQLMEAKDSRIRALEEELAALKGEMENDRQLRLTEEAETRERERMENLERDEAVRAQLNDITNLVQEQRDHCERKKELMDQRWDEKLSRREEKDLKVEELHDMMSKIIHDREVDRQRAEEERLAAEAKPGIEAVIEELRRQNAEQRELLNALSDTWRADCSRHHEETLNAVRATAHEQVPFNVQGYLDEFSKALASEVRMLLGEVGKLREERRAIQYELGYLMCMKSKYAPGGEFDPDYRPPTFGATTQPAPEAAVPEAAAPPEDQAPARPAWRTVHQRASRKSKKKDNGEARHSRAQATPAPDPRQQVSSWATWQPDPNLQPTPPSVEPTLLVPDRGSPGLFGPRSPRDSYHR